MQSEVFFNTKHTAVMNKDVSYDKQRKKMYKALILPDVRDKLHHFMVMVEKLLHLFNKLFILDPLSFISKLIMHQKQIYHNAQFIMCVRECVAWIFRCVYLCSGTNPVKGGVQCQRISQTPFDSREQLYLNKAKILWENPSNLLIPISVFGFTESSILLICFCLSATAGGF